MASLKCLSKVGILGVLIIQNTAWADSASEMARKLQDPLADIAAVMTDNNFFFSSNTKNPSISFQIQPVKAFDLPNNNVTLIARGLFPILGFAPMLERPNLSSSIPAGNSRLWGLGDIIGQFFFSPKTSSKWKWGVGPQVALKSRTKPELAGAGWGSGVAAVLAGSFGANISSAFIINHMWGNKGTFSTSSVQPMIFYNIPSNPGMALGYNAPINYDWKNTAGSKWTIPIGASISKTFDLGNNYGLDTSLGAYSNIVKPTGAANWQINFGASVLLP